MNIPFLIGAILASVGFVAHVFIGERLFKHIADELWPAMGSFKGIYVRQLARVAWHILSVALLLAVIAFLAMTFTTLVTNPITIAHFIALHFGGYAIVISVLPLLAFRRPDTLLRLPQWIPCVLIAGFAWWGTLSL